MNNIIKILLSILNLNHLTGVSEIELIRMRMTMRVCVISFVFGTTYSLFLPLLGLHTHALVSFTCAFGYIIIGFIIYYNKFELAKILHTINSSWGIFAFSSFLGKESGFHLFILLSPIFVLSLYNLDKKVKIFSSISIYILTFLLFLKFNINPIFQRIDKSILTPTIIDYLYLLNILFIIILSTTLVSYILKLNAKFLLEILDKNKALLSTQKMLSNEVVVRKSSEEKIRIMYEELQVSFDRLKHFNQMVSHNLRAPIANLIGLSQLMEDEDIEKDERLILISNIKKTSIKLDGVIQDMNQILTINKDINEVKTFIDLESAVQKVLESEEDILSKIDSNLELKFDKAKGLISVSSFIHSIFHNLLSNAIKYRKQDQKLLISIHSELVDNVFKITFSDNGLGMDLIANPNKLFKPYSRFHADILGKGIGLYLVQSQIQMLGGTIIAESQVNVGTTFIITIPV